MASGDGREVARMYPSGIHDFARTTIGVDNTFTKEARSRRARFRQRSKANPLKSMCVTACPLVCLLRGVIALPACCWMELVRR